MIRMISAELLKLRRTRAVWWSAAIPIVCIPFGVLLLNVLVAGDRVAGIERSGTTLQLLLGPGLIGATILGVTAGGADRTSGVLRSLVSTGRPRAQLFWARVPAVLMVSVAMTLLMWAVTCAIGTVVHVDTHRVTASWALDQLPSLLVANTVFALSALGLCSAGIGSAPVVGLVLALVLGVAPIAASIGVTPDWLLALMPPLSVTELVGGASLAESVGFSGALAAAGLAVWVVGSLGAGLHRTQHADV